MRSPHRWHRWLTVPSGWTLFVCLFLPTIKLCDTSEPVPMALFPFIWPVYVMGALIALAALRPPWAIRGYGLALFVLLRASAVGVAGTAVPAIVMGESGAEAVLAVMLSGLVFAATWRDATERAVAGVSLLVTAGAFAFTLLLACDRLAVWGATAGAISAGALVLGCLCWSIEASVRSD